RSSRRAAPSRVERVTAPKIPNLFKVPELKDKILFTLLALLVYRIGAHIATPGVNVQALAAYAQRSQGTLFSLYDLFAGGGLSRAAVFALGIMPYISASIVFQLAGPVFPIIEKMQRDEEGRKKLTQWTRYLTVLLCLFQSYGYSLFIQSQIPGAVTMNPFGFKLLTVLTLTDGGGDGGGAAHPHPDPPQGDGPGPHPGGSEDFHPAAHQLVGRDADHFRAVPDHRARHAGAVQQHPVAQGLLDLFQLHLDRVSH